MSDGSKCVETKEVKGQHVDIYACYSDHKVDPDFWDLFIDGECINLGEPCYEYPTKEDIEAFLELREELMK